jgi:hypothetical protein
MKKLKNAVDIKEQAWGYLENGKLIRWERNGADTCSDTSLAPKTSNCLFLR